MKFIHAADIHLGAEPDKGKSWSGERKKEIYSTFERLIQETNEQKADFLFLCGDIFINLRQRRNCGNWIICLGNCILLKR